MNESSTASTAKTAKTAKRYSEAIKTQVLGECDTAGAVIKAVAQKHGIPISLVHKWRYKAKCRTSPRLKVGDFVALPIISKAVSKTASMSIPEPRPASGMVANDTDIRIDLQGGTTTARVHWPLNAGAQCAVWLRELLQ